MKKKFFCLIVCVPLGIFFFIISLAIWLAAKLVWLEDEFQMEEMKEIIPQTIKNKGGLKCNT